MDANTENAPSVTPGQAGTAVAPAVAAATAIAAVDPVPSRRQMRRKWDYDLRSEHYDGVTPERKVTFPLLNNKNYQDLFASEEVLGVEPWKAPYGQTGTVWEEIVASLNKRQAPDGTYVRLLR